MRYRIEDMLMEDVCNFANSRKRFTGLVETSER